MLALRPWSAYELTRQMRRSLDYCWPKAESVLHGEPKRLVQLGLAAARREQLEALLSRMEELWASQSA
jgi:PadR family transcriptional regulator, regulatory protein AphA